MGHWQMVSDIQKDLGIDLDDTGRELDEDLYSECSVDDRLPEAAYLGPCELGNIFNQSIRIWRRHMFAFMLTLLLPVTILALGSIPLDLLFGDVQEGPIYWVTTAIRLCLFCWSVVCMQKAHLDIIDFDRCSPTHWFVHPRQAVSAALGLQLILLVLLLPLIGWFPLSDTELEGEGAGTYFVASVLWLFVVWWVIFRMHSFWYTFADLRVNALSGIRHAWAGSRGHVWRLFWADISLGFACCVISILTLCLAAPFLVAWVFCFEAVFYRTMHPRVD